MQNARNCCLSATKSILPLAYDAEYFCCIGQRPARVPLGGIALLLTAVVVAFKQSWQALGLKLERWIPESRKPALTVISGLILGVLVSLSSIGAGAIVMAGVQIGVEIAVAKNLIEEVFGSAAENFIDVVSHGGQRRAIVDAGARYPFQR